MIRRPPRSNLPDTLFPGTRLCRSCRPPRLVKVFLRGAGLAAGGKVQRAPGRPLHDRRGVEVHQRHRRVRVPAAAIGARSEEHTSELQSLMRISYAVFCLKKKTQTTTHIVSCQSTPSITAPSR